MPDPTNPAVAMVPTQSGDGYYLVFADGSVYAYGDAIFQRFDGR